ncbi:hypothetical protein [Microbacter margulisiae]|uniref:Uncharacterized protein n=1 Tax=Microbacter margulisiae TaxID=1350067 RepID=A0A7W5H390_9PORP|nr:hypothetical protein [Microbacter margulisiae]MBB3188162.1 hypothetical protein [Microbacter margulisiae]
MKLTQFILRYPMGYDYTFKNSLYLQLEGLYNGNNSSNNLLSLDQFNNNNLSAENLFLSGFSFFSSLSYPFSPLVNGSLAGIYNVHDQLLILIPSLTISLQENLELSFTAQLVQNVDKKNAFNQNINLIYARLKKSF